MSAAPVPPLQRNARAPSSRRSHTVEIVALERYCGELLLGYAADLYPAEIASAPASNVTVHPPDRADWLVDVLGLVARWLASAGLPCANVVYGGRTYLIRSSFDVAQFRLLAEAVTPVRSGVHLQ